MDKDINKKVRRPPCTITRNKEPDMELMAKAFINLHQKIKDKNVEKSADVC